MSARNRELFGLIPASLLVTGGFTAVLLTRVSNVHSVTLTYGAIFLGCCVFAHLFIRWRLPNADPYLFPIAAVLASVGLVELYRIQESYAIKQAGWFALGLVFFCGTIVFLRDYRVLERYRYTIAAASIGLLLLPRVPGIGQNVNGAYLGVKLGPLAFQPAEFAKIGIIIFLASYLRDTRQLLVTGGRRFLGITIPPLKHFGPLLLVWGVAMAMLFFIQDIGSSPMFFRGFPGGLHLATHRGSFVPAGLAMFAFGSGAPFH